MDSPRRLIPTPNIQSNLGPLLDWKRPVPSLRDPSSIRPQILPEDRIPFDRLERDSFSLPLLTIPVPLTTVLTAIIIIAFQKPAPRPRARPPQSRKIRPPSHTIRRQIHHKRTNPIPASRRRPRPVEMMPVMPRRVVPLRPHALDVQVRAPALEGARAVFDAADDVVAG